MLDNKNIPDDYKKDIEKAVKILKDEGCIDVYLFGSVAQGKLEGEADIDLAVKGCPTGKYFDLLGRLMIELDHPVDLVNLDKDKDLAAFLFKEGELVRVT